MTEIVPWLISISSLRASTDLTFSCQHNATMEWQIDQLIVQRQRHFVRLLNSWMSICEKHALKITIYIASWIKLFAVVKGRFPRYFRLVSKLAGIDGVLSKRLLSFKTNQSLLSRGLAFKLNLNQLGRERVRQARARLFLSHCIIISGD